MSGVLPAHASWEEARCWSGAPRKGVLVIRVILTVTTVRVCVLLALMRHRGARTSLRSTKRQGRPRPGAHLSSPLGQSPRRPLEFSLNGRWGRGALSLLLPATPTPVD